MSEAPRVYLPNRYERRYIEGEGDLRASAEVLAQSDAIGVDIEMGQRLLRKPGGLQEWKHILALVQISSDTLSVVVDPLRCDDLSPLEPLMAGSVRKVFLGGGQDVSMLEQAGLPVRNIADVGEVAYAIFGRREDGMAALAKRIFGLNLDKTIRRADWLVRPLSRHLLTYAYQDAELTLLIYRWFQNHYPHVLAFHEREELEPSVPPSTPPWLREALSRPSGDLTLILNEFNLDAERDAEQLAGSLRAALAHYSRAPRRINRLVRLAGDLKLPGLLPVVVDLSNSPSSLLRASAARSMGKIGESDAVQEHLETLARDPIEDVRRAAEAGLRDLKAQRKADERPPEPAEEEVPSLDPAALDALRQVLEQLEDQPS